MFGNPDELRYKIANWQAPKPDAYNPYAAGAKQYGAAGTGAGPNQGPVGMAGQQGYAERDRMAQVRRNAYLARAKANQAGQYMSPEWLGMEPQIGR